MFDKNSSQNSKRLRQFHELDERLQRWQREHPVQAWAVTFCSGAAFVGLLWLFGVLLAMEVSNG
jgi:Flp pilus assembly protein TadB